MANSIVKSIAGSLAIAAVIAPAALLHAQFALGTWANTQTTMTMTVEACCNGGRRFVYRIQGTDTVLMSNESPMDGTDVAVMIGGKPSGETMGIKKVDDHHVFTVLKMNGKQFGTSKATISADGKTMTVENDVTSTASGNPIGKSVETWIRK